MRPGPLAIARRVPFRARRAVRTARAALAVIAAGLLFSPGARAATDDGIRLSVSRGASPGEILLDWTGARPGFEVFRAADPRTVTADAAHRLTLMRERHLADLPPSGDAIFYQVLPRWPQFYSSDAAHDDLLNDLFVRHARAEYADDSLRRPDSANPANWTVTLWRDWEVDELLWHDYSPLNYPLDERVWFFAYMTAVIPVDKFGYYFSGGAGPEPPTAAPNCCFRQGWAFPTYADSQGHSTGWEWNASDAGGWTLVNAKNDSAHDGEWYGSTTKADPRLISPAIAVDAFQAPFVDFEIQYDRIDLFAQPGERTWRFYWQTADAPTWSLDRSVTSDSFPLTPAGPFAAGGTLATFHLPLHLHPGWNGQTITRVRLDPLETTVPRTGSWRLNFLRLDYDTRESVNNPIFVRAVARKFFWDGDTGYLAGQLARLRQATQFMLTHMRGAELNLPDHAWFTGHDGVGWAGINQPRVGHGLPNNWFDIVTTGPRDLLAAIRFYTALSAMAEIEAWIEVNPEFDSPKPAVLGPDGSSTVPYAESAASLRARLPSVRAAIRAEFWDPLSGRYATWRGADGVLRDYGAVHANLEALAAGIPDAAEARSVLDWLDGRRTVAGDTSTGPDLYVHRFAARANARRNAFDWIWGWSGWTVPFEGQVEDGGSSLHTTFFDVQGRLRYGDVAGAWAVWFRMLDHHRTVREFGGRGANFYRDYYAAHPELGALQGCGVPGGIGLDCEFVENMLVPAAWPVAWLGIESNAPGVLRIAPSRPPSLDEMGVRSVVYRGHRLDVRHGPGTIDLRGSTLGTVAPETLELVFRGHWPPEAIVLRDGVPAPGDITRALEGLTLRTPLAAALFEVREMPASDQGAAGLASQNVHPSVNVAP